MIKIILIPLVMMMYLGIFSSYAQVGRYNSNQKIYTIVDEMPEFPGGEEALYTYLKAVPFPSGTSSERQVIVHFLVDTVGKVRNVSIKQSSGIESIDRIAVNHIKSMPQWKPGKTMGAPAIVAFTLPLPYETETGKSKKKRRRNGR